MKIANQTSIGIPRDRIPLTQQQLDELSIQVLIHRKRSLDLQETGKKENATSAEMQWRIADRLAEWRDQEMGLRN
jgi:hypothetical protein